MKFIIATIFATICIISTTNAIRFLDSTADNNLDWIAQFTASPKNSTFHGSVKFNWSGVHNVYEMASKAAYDSCDFKDAKNLGEATGVVVTGNTGDVKYYSCEIGSHCTKGQKVAITWAASKSTTPATTITTPATTTSSTMIGYSFKNTLGLIAVLFMALL